VREWEWDLLGAHDGRGRGIRAAGGAGLVVNLLLHLLHLLALLSRGAGHLHE
jgi:hypothetical protein